MLFRSEALGILSRRLSGSTLLDHDWHDYVETDPELLQQGLTAG